MQSDIAHWEKRVISEQKEQRIRQLYNKLRREGLPLPDFPLDGLTEKQVRDKIIRRLAARKRAKNIRSIRRRNIATRRHAKVITFIAGSIVFSILIAAPFNDFDYIYYQYLRWIVTAWFSWMLFSQWKNLGIFFKTAYVLAIITFNPFAPIHLDRETWAINDISAAMLIPFAALWPRTQRWYTRAALIIATLSAGAAIAYYAGEANHSSSSSSRQAVRRAPARRSKR
jgi:hypothetical protein